MCHLVFLSHTYIERDEERLIGFSVNDVQKMRKENSEAGWILLCVLRSIVVIVWAESAAKTQVTGKVKHSSCLVPPQTACPHL